MATRQDWMEELGFWDVPRRVTLPNDVLAWRVWGGTSGEGLGDRARGLFLTTERPLTRSDAEKALAVMEHGNACRFATRFRIDAHTPLYIGTVHPGDADRILPGVPGTQIFVERSHCHHVRPAGPAVRLTDDMPGIAVLSRRLPRGHRDA